MSVTPKDQEGRQTSKEELVRLLLGEIDRTFTSEGHEDGLRAVGELFRRLDETTLCDMAYSMGIEPEQQLMEEEEEKRAKPS